MFKYNVFWKQKQQYYKLLFFNFFFFITPQKCTIIFVVFTEIFVIIKTFSVKFQNDRWNPLQIPGESENKIRPWSTHWNFQHVGQPSEKLPSWCLVYCTYGTDDEEFRTFGALYTGGHTNIGGTIQL